ncbi:hypothetical protein Gohar_011743, partial [Gossypium harknessii]|nr:hypothetical protein [Gossypium harknessii]
IGIEDDAIKVNTASIYFTDVAFLWWHHRSTNEKREIIKLTVAMAEAESFVELGLIKDEFESSKPNRKGNGERNHEDDKEGHSDDGNSIDSTSGNKKPRDAK